MTGPDLGLLDEVRLLAGELRVIASGGVGSLDDIRALAAAGAEAVVVGRALYEGRFTLGEAITAAN
jgi:phosphoribosylformimino-5-aminoimidazole carboxamide ribotide isomerase